MPYLTREQAHRQFFIYLGFVVPMLLALGIALAIRYWVGALFAGAFLLLMVSWLKRLYALAWPDSRPLLPFGFRPRLSNRQRAFVELGLGILLAVSVLLLLPNTLGLVLGAVMVVAGLFGFALNLKGKGWPGQQRNEK